MAVGNEEPVLRRIETRYLIGSNHHFGHQLCNWVGCGGVGWGGYSNAPEGGSKLKLTSSMIGDRADSSS